jgi:hypothetical protein
LDKPGSRRNGRFSENIFFDAALALNFAGTQSHWVFRSIVTGHSGLSRPAILVDRDRSFRPIVTARSGLS